MDIESSTTHNWLNDEKRNAWMQKKTTSPTAKTQLTNKNTHTFFKNKNKRMRLRPTVNRKIDSLIRKLFYFPYKIKKSYLFSWERQIPFILIRVLEYGTVRFLLLSHSHTEKANRIRKVLLRSVEGASLVLVSLSRCLFGSVKINQLILSLYDSTATFDDQRKT